MTRRRRKCSDGTDDAAFAAHGLPDDVLHHNSGLICGAFAERMKFSAYGGLLWALWGLLVYCPLAHWVWSAKGFLNAFNTMRPIRRLTYAGGAVVHISSGISALVVRDHDR